ncbi:MAG: esterase [Betaproteobacteria bacterium]|nr:esterase [Betaproteobacteria bacterium]
MPPSLVIARPAGPVQQLVLLFHGVGADEHDMLPLGRRLAAEFPQACVVSVRAPHACAAGRGYQWFGVQGIDEQNRVERVARALPQFLETVRDWQRETAASVAQTALVGFSQGGIMALESTRDREAPAGRVASIGGRFARLPGQPTAGTTLHLLHGKRDPVMPYALTIEAAEHLVRLGADVTADVLPFVGHEAGPEVAECLVQRLRTYVPLRVWREALASDPGSPGTQYH